MRLFRKLLLWTTVFLLIGGIWAGLHASSKGFTKSWREIIRKEFAERGVEISIGKLTLDPFNGLVARNVNLYDGPDQQHLVATISQIDLDISLPRMLRGDITLNGIHVRNADLSILVDPTRDNSQRVHISKFNSRIVLNNERMEIQEAHGKVFGTTINIAGSFLHQSDSPTQHQEIELKGLSDQTYQNISLFFSSLESLEFPSGHPAELNIHATASFNDLDNGQYNASFRASSLRWNEIDTSDVELRLAFANGLMQLEEFRLRDDHGAMRMVADYQPSTRRLTFNLESSTKLTDHLRMHLWPETLPPLLLSEAPTINLGGTLDIPETDFWTMPHAELSGSLNLSHGSIANQQFNSASCLIATEGGNLYLKDINLLANTGKLQGNILLHRNRQHIQLQGTLPPPAILASLPLPNDLRTWLDIHDHPKSTFAWNFQARRSSWESNWGGEGFLQGENFTWRDTPVRHAQTNARWDGNEIHFLNSSLELPAGIAHGFDQRPSRDPSELSATEISLNPSNGNIQLTGISGTAYPQPILHIFAPTTAHHLNPYAFNKAPRLTLNGSLNIHTSDHTTDLHITANSNDKVDVLFSQTTIPLENPSAEFHFSQDSLKINGLKATLLDGKIHANLTFDNLNETPHRFSSTTQWENISLPQLIALQNGDAPPPDNAKGRLSGQLNLNNPSGKQGDLHGDGNTTLHNGNLFSLPLFTPLAPKIDAALLGSNLADKLNGNANAEFTIANGTLTTRDFTSTTSVFEMRGSGTIHAPFTTGETNFTIHIEPSGLARIAASLIDKPLKFTSHGPIHNPQWRLSQPAEQVNE